MHRICVIIVCSLVLTGCGTSNRLPLQQRIDRARKDMHRLIEAHNRYLEQETTPQGKEREKKILQAYQEGLELLDDVNDDSFRPTPVIASFYTLKPKEGYPPRHFYVEWIEKNDQVKGFYVTGSNEKNSPPAEFLFFQEPEDEDLKFPEWTVTHHKHVWFAETEEEATNVRETMGLQCFKLDSDLAQRIYEEIGSFKVGLITDQGREGPEFDAIIYDSEQ